MNVFLYSPKKTLVTIGEKSFILNKNLVKINTLKGETFRFDFQDAFQPATFSPCLKFYKNVAITDLYGDILCYPILIPSLNYPYKKLIEREFTFNFTQFIFSVYLNGGIKLKCRALSEEVVFNLPIKPIDLEVRSVGPDLILIDLKNTLHYIIILSVQTLKTEFCDLVDDYFLDRVLSTTKFRRGINLYEETCVYEYNNEVILTSKTFQTFNNYKTLPKELIPLVFLEEVRLGVDYRRFLADSLISRHELFKGFFGDFSFVLPPFYEDLSDTYGVVYNNRVKYAKFALADDKISDVSLEDSF